MNKITGIIGAFILLSVASCHPGNSSSQGGSNRDTVPEPGVIHPRVIMTADPSCSYALYLPLQFTASKAWPLLLAFDPHGNGLIPVEKYRCIAEKYGYILIGSNDSHNGLTLEQAGHILDLLLDEGKNRYPVDTDRVFLMGFSGGSRVAGFGALTRAGIRGVICCGAALPADDRPPLHRFGYFGIAGTADFNLSEIVGIRKHLDRFGIQYFIGTFEGDHAWPPSSVMETALIWHEVNLMHDLGKSVHDTMNIFLQSRIAEMNAYVAYLDAHPSILIREQKEQEILMQALFEMDMGWWKKRISNYEVRMMNGGRDDSLMGKRLLSWLSLLCYSNLSAAMKQDNRILAGQLIPIYKLADPDNPEPHFQASMLAIRNSDSTEAISELSVAIAKGFNDRARIMRQREFDEVKADKEFFDLLKKMK